MFSCNLLQSCKQVWSRASRQWQ